MKKWIEHLLLSSIFLLVGLTLIFLLNNKFGVISIILFLITPFLSEEIRKWIIKILKEFSNSEFLKHLGIKNEGEQVVEGSEGVARAGDGGVAIGKLVIDNSTKNINEILREGKLSIIETKIGKNSDNSKRKKNLREIYKKMAKVLKPLNEKANNGIESKEDFDKIVKLIKDFEETKVVNGLELDDEVEKKLNKVMSSFRHTQHELFLKVRDGKFGEGLHGNKSFEFINKFYEATNEINKKLE